MKLNIPEYAERVLRRIEDARHEAYLVGGCVRDSLMGRVPKDFDIATSALPNEVMEIFTSEDFTAIPTGISHGTITVVQGKAALEVTTFRIDGEYSDFRRPNEVSFTPSISEDLKRRDFTVNAMAYSPHRGLIDPHGGAADIEKGIIRSVGDAEIRFSEDALRILRGIRFCSVLDFSMEENTGKAALKLAGLLEKISRERICRELSMLLCGMASPRILTDYGDLISHLLGIEINKAIPDIFALLNKLSANLSVRLAAIFLSEAETELPKRLSAQRFDGKTIWAVIDIISGFKAEIHSRAEIKRLCRKVGLHTAKGIILLKISTGAADLQLLDHFEDIISNGECVSIRDLAVNGDDLIRIGMEGSEIGKTLEYLLDSVVDGTVENTPSALIDAAKYKNKRKNGHERSSSL